MRPSYEYNPCRAPLMGAMLTEPWWGDLSPQSPVATTSIVLCLCDLQVGHDSAHAGRYEGGERDGEPISWPKEHA